MFEDYDRGERIQKAGMFRARLIIFGFVIVGSLIAVGIARWNKSSLHEKLSLRHEQATASFTSVYPNGKAPNIVYSIGYTFTVNGKTYENYGESTIKPKYPRGIVFYNPDNPEENELQPISNDGDLPLRY